MVPALLQSRLPAFHALRQSASRFSILSSHRQQTPLESEVKMEMELKEAAIVKKTNPVVQVQTRKAAAPVAASSTVVDRRVEREEPSRSPAKAAKGSTPINSGIKWNYAQQGMVMHHAAAREHEDADFAKKVYIDGIAYMLQALPEDLSEHELATIYQGLPAAPGLLEAPPHPAAQAKLPETGMATYWARQCLRRVVQWLVTMAVLLAHAFAGLVHVGAQYERQYHISQHLVARGCVVATAVGKYTVQLSGKVYAIGDGPIGRAVASLVAWTFESVTGGIEDGIRQGSLIAQQTRE